MQERIFSCCIFVTHVIYCIRIYAIKLLARRALANLQNRAARISSHPLACRGAASRLKCIFHAIIFRRCNPSACFGFSIRRGLLALSGYRKASAVEERERQEEAERERGRRRRTKKIIGCASREKCAVMQRRGRDALLEMHKTSGISQIQRAARVRSPQIWAPRETGLDRAEFHFCRIKIGSHREPRSSAPTIGVPFVSRRSSTTCNPTGLKYRPFHERSRAGYPPRGGEAY